MPSWLNSVCDSGFRVMTSESRTYRPHIGAGIARPVVARKEQFQLFARSPTAAETEHPADAPNLDQSADAGHEEKIGHARAPFTATAAAGAFSGQGTYGYSK